MSPEKNMIITDNAILRVRFDELGEGDVFVGRVRLRPSEEALLLDMVSRGVRFFPSAVAQLASRSKSFQATILGRFMLAHTMAIHDQHDMLAAVNRYGKHGVERVITKHDRRNAGMGVHLWHNVEDVNTQASLGTLAYPFVLQPFYKNCRDIRVIVLDDYIEAYWRRNPNNFRNNLHCGGESAACDLSNDQMALCRKVMERGGFPYAHVDLLVTEEDEVFLAEINLRGGIRGAKISPPEYRVKVQQILDDKIREFKK